MVSKLAVITPTGDRPLGLELCAKWMRRQAYRGDVVWIISDDGKTETETPVRDGWEVVHLNNHPADREHSLAVNVVAGIEEAKRHSPWALVIVEDDDYYFPEHLSTVARKLVEAPRVGNDKLRYYHVGLRRHRVMQNTGASLCQTAMRWDDAERLVDACRRATVKDSYGIDEIYWRGVRGNQWPKDLYADPVTVIGMKGLPGRRGYGIGHRETRVLGWDHDPGGDKLRKWIGDDAEVYLELGC